MDFMALYHEGYTEAHTQKDKQTDNNMIAQVSFNFFQNKENRIQRNRKIVRLEAKGRKNDNYMKSKRGRRRIK
jgi:hypothetical protein